MTIRRDLDELAELGVLRRVHGGVVAASPRGEQIPYAVRLESLTTEKAAIARTAAALVPDGSSVVVDAGTTAAAVAHELAGRDLTVMALSVHAAAALGRCPGTTIVTPGGRLESHDLSWVGSTVVEDLGGFRADVVVLGVCAWDPIAGLTSRTPEDTATKKAALRSGTRVVAVATAEKLGVLATFGVGPTEAVDTLVTTADADAAHLSALRDRGVDVALAT